MALFFISINLLHAEDRDMVLEGLDGDVTTNEYQAFIDKLNYLPPPPTNNVDNHMVDERDGARLHGMQTFYAFTHDRRDLDMAIVWSDAFLHARNDSANGRIIWTGQRDLCWPNMATNDGVWALHSGVENGDVIEHIVNTARLILENPSIWSEQAPTDTFGFGATYLGRAETYVRECQRSADTTIVPWFVRTTKDGYRLYYPDSAAYFKSSDGNESGPIPWNQQQAIVGGLLRLAQCHRLLNDGNTNIAYYEQITADAAAWFFANAVPVSVKNHVCYLWSYGLPRDPTVSPEVTYESDYDMFIYRAYQAHLGPTRRQMQRLINTGRYLMYLGTNRVSGYINGTSDNNSSRHERHYFEFEWIEMSVLDHNFYRMTAGNILAIHEYWDNFVYVRDIPKLVIGFIVGVVLLCLCVGILASFPALTMHHPELVFTGVLLFVFWAAYASGEHIWEWIEDRFGPIDVPSLPTMLLYVVVGGFAVDGFHWPIERFPQVAQRIPDWVLILVGLFLFIGSVWLVEYIRRWIRKRLYSRRFQPKLEHK